MKSRYAPFRRIISSLLAVLLILTFVPVQVFADDGTAVGYSLGYSGTTLTTEVTLNGSPVQGKWVSLYQDGYYMNQAYTELDGTATFQNVSVGSGYYFRVDSANDHLQYDGREIGKTFALPGTVPSVELDPGNTVSTRVTLNGQGVPNREVSLYKDGSYIANGWTDAVGYVTLNYSIADGSGYYFRVYGSSNYVTYNGSDLGKTFDLPGMIPTIELNAGNQVTTRLTLNGQGVPHTYVSLYQNGSYITSGWADAMGNVTFSDSIADGSGYYFALSGTTDYLWYDGSDLGKTFDLPGTVPTIELNAGNLVTTRLTVNGQGVPNTWVYLNKDGYSIIVGWADSVGNVTFDRPVADGEGYYFTVYGTSDYVDYDGRNEGEVFSLPGNIPAIELTVSESIRTTVTLDGELLRNSARVTLYRGDQQVDWNYSDANGEVQFSGLKPGMYRFTATATNALYYTGEYFTLPGEVPVIALESGNTITTTVTLNGVPVEDAYVTLNGTRGSFAGYRTDSNGMVTFDKMRDGKWYFTVDGTDQYARYDGSKLDQVFTVPGPVPAIELSAGGTITTKVLRNGAPVSGVRVQVVDIDSYQNGSVEYSADDGSVSFANMSDSIYYFTVYDQNNCIYDGWLKDQIFAFPGEVPVIELTGQTISTKVLLDGQPAQGVAVDLVAKISTVERAYLTWTFSDENGIITFEGVPEGVELYFEVEDTDWSNGYDGSRQGETFRVGDAIPVVHLSSKQSVSTTVTLNGIPQSSLEVVVYRGDGLNSAEYARSWTNSEGLVTFNLEPGLQYFFVVEENWNFAYYNGYDHGKPFSVGGSIPKIELETGLTITTKVLLDGVPKGGVKVYLDNPTYYYSDAYSYIGYSNSQGIVTFTNVPSIASYPYYFSVDHALGEYAYFRSDNFQIPGSSIPEIHLTSGITITTKVTHDGVPRKGISVRLIQPIVGARRETLESNQDGNVTFYNVDPNATYRFYVERREYDYAQFDAEFIPSQSVPNIALITGETVTTRVTQKGIGKAGVGIELIRGGVDEYDDPNDYIAYAYSQRDGQLTIRNIAPGNDYAFLTYGWTGSYDYYVTNAFAVPSRSYPVIELDPAYRPSGSGSSSRRSSSGGTSTADGYRQLRSETTSTRAVDTQTATDLTQDALKKLSETGGTATVRVKDRESISLEAMQAMVKTAGDVPVKLYADSMNDKSVDVRITIDPGKATKGILLGASTISDRAKAVQSKFDKWFTNAVKVISLKQQESFGMEVEIAVKWDSSISVADLHFYSYDNATNTYKRITTPNPWLDANGYLHFTTSLAGDIVISEGPLNSR